jgi:hypothetical protein
MANETLPNEQSSDLPPLEEPVPLIPDRNVEPAVLPRGLVKQIDYVLTHHEAVRESIRRDEELWRFSRVFVLIAVAMAACYGVVMGGTNWLQGQDALPFNQEFLLMLVTGVKVPVLYLLTLLIVVTPIYVSSTFVGSGITFSQMVALLLSSTAIMATTLASMASVAFFFSLTTTSYAFIKLLHVVFFAYAGVAGIAYLLRGFHAIAPGAKRATLQWIFVLWLVLYMFVGTQMAWSLRPFVGSPELEFQLFRQKEGNFYENVFQSIGDVLEEPESEPPAEPPDALNL